MIGRIRPLLEHLRLEWRVAILVLLLGLLIGKLFDHYQQARLEQALNDQLRHQQQQTLNSAQALVYTHFRLTQRLLDQFAHRPAVEQRLSDQATDSLHRWAPPIDSWRGILYPDCFRLYDNQERIVATWIVDPAEGCPRNGRNPLQLLDAGSQLRVQTLNNGQTWLQVFAPVPSSQGGSAGWLELTIHLDPPFLQTLFGKLLPNDSVLALVNNEGIVIAATTPDIPTGVPTDRHLEAYYAGNIDFLDEGDWDNLIGIGIWIRRSLLYRIEQEALELAATQRLALSATYIALLVLIAHLLTRRIQQLRNKIRDFATHLLDETPSGEPQGHDIFRQTESELQHLLSAVEEDRATQLIQHQIAAAREQLELMERMANHLGVGLLAHGDIGTGDPLNSVMRRYLAELPSGAALALTHAGDNPRVTVHDIHGHRRIFEIIDMGIAPADQRHIYLVRDATHEHRQREELEHLALHDVLTGLPNRKLLANRIEVLSRNARRKKQPFCLLLFDLNDFKTINDHFGHSIGDQALIEIAQRFSPLLREQDSFARLGGDEFAILLPETDLRGARTLAHRMLDEQREHPLFIGGTPYEIGLSIGAVCCPEHGCDMERLLARADIAMYHAKRKRLGYAEFSNDLEKQDAERLHLHTALRKAILEERLELVYQPLWDPVSHTVHGWEALARWTHPQQGPVPPDVFIPLAEKTGLINELTELVLQRALEDCARWRAAGISGGVSINLSALDLLNPELPAKLETLTRENSLEAPLVTIEITESVLMQDPPMTSDILEKLDQKGFWSAIDDFGSGYSSLAYLQKLPVHELKIDRAFIDAAVDNTISRNIVEGILTLARSLHLNVVAEGVEDTRTARWLIERGCDYLQGYAIGRPIPLEDVLRWQQPDGMAS